VAAGDLLGISVSGAIAAKRALDTTGHNIANASTPGYSRQRVDMEARTPQLFGNGAQGTGVLVDNIRRVSDDFLVGEVRDTASASEYLEASHDLTSQVDNMLADPKAGLAPSISDFFSSVNELANNPASSAARQVVLSSAQNLSDRFGYLNNRFESLRDSSNQEMENVVAETNQLAKGIAEINGRIIRAREIASKAPNDLLDQRDRLVERLAKNVSVRTSLQDDGRMNVFIGNGQTLVVGDRASKLAVQDNEHDPSVSEVMFVSDAGAKSNITRFLTGGKLGGVINFRKELLDPAQNELGRIAHGIARTFNDQHKLGMDLNNELGGDFFKDIGDTSPAVFASTRNKGDLTLSAKITDLSKLTTSNYELSYRDGEYQLLRLQDNKVIGRYKNLPQEISSEGFRLDIDSGQAPQNGDKFMIYPTRFAGRDFGVEVNTIDKIAAASPIRVEGDVSNLGNAEIEVNQITDTDNDAFAKQPGQLSPPYVVRFVDDRHFEILDNSGKPVKVAMDALPDDPAIALDQTPKGATPATPASETGDRAIPATPPRKDKQQRDAAAQGLKAVEGPIEYDPRKGVEVFPTAGGIDRGFHIRIKGEPKAGDLFKIEFNKDGTSDNGNALALARLQSKPTLQNGTADYAQAYGQLVSRVGSKTHELDINREAQKLLLDQANEAREAMSGVNLDEEAANMVRYQNLFQANAQVIGTANQMFQSLINVFRR
jgi:flagellar hook-associated protein 1 FlgK